jgi:hypothetical protein
VQGALTSWPVHSHSAFVSWRGRWIGSTGWGERAFVGRLDQLTEQPHVLQDASEALVLQALRAASDPMNLALLRHLSVEEATGLAELAAELPLERIALHVRLGELAQAGLVALELEREAARLTALGNALRD